MENRRATAAPSAILLVEDEAIIALAESRILSRRGYSVLVAASGEKAVELVRGGAPVDLVLMDIDLGGGMDGTEAARHILGLRDLPLVFLSSHTESEIVEKTEGITSYGYIVKNSGETVLLASIKMAFRLFAARSELRDREEHYRSLFENAVGPVWIEDFSAFKRRVGELRDAGLGDFRAWLAANPTELFELAELVRIVDINEAGRVSLGLAADEPWPRTLRSFLGPEARSFLGEEFCVLAEGGTTFETEVRIEQPGADPGVLFLSLKVIPGYEKDLSRVHVLLHDLSAVRRTELALKRSESRNAALLEAIPDLMFAFSKEGVIIDCRTPDPALLLAPPAELVGKHLSSILPADIAELTLRKLASVLGSGRPEIYDYRLELDRRRRFESRLVPMGADACLAIVREIED
ncbi:MAG: response regulator [Spirochaetaceae bacterium]|nr:response regulator [Spirochaetaceae bacterium]